MKLIRFILMASLAVLITNTAKASLVAYYDFNNQSDLKIDSSGTGKTLTVYDGSSIEGDYSADGVNDGCLDINASTQGYRAAYGEIFSAGDFSFSAWVKVEGSSSIILQPYSTDGGFQITIAANTLRFWLFRSTGTGMAYVALNSGVAPAVDQWMHLAMTFDTDGTVDEFGNYSGDFKYYIDGVLKSTSTQVYHNAGYRGTTSGICLGKRSSAVFNGKYDDIAFYDTILTDYEVGALADNLCTPLTAEGFVAPQVTTLVGYYSFDDDTNMINDDSGNGLDLINDGSYLVTDYTADGAVNGAAQFDGSTQGYLADASLYTAGSFTVSLWSKSNTEGSTAQQMIIRPYNNGNGYSIQLVNGEYRFYTYYGGSYSYVRLGVYATAGDWDHLVMTFDSTGIPDANGHYTGTLNAYVDGVKAVSLADAKYGIANPAYLCFGKRATACYNGVMDEFAVFSGVLSDLEIEALNLKLATPLDVIGYTPVINIYEPIAYFGFNDPNEPTQGLKMDDSGNGMHLSLYDIDAEFSDYGVSGGCADFSGATQGYRQASTAIFPDGDFSFGTWIKTEGASGMIVQPLRFEGGFQITIASNTLRFWIFRSTGTGGAYTVINSGVAPAMDEWMHLAVTFDTDGVTDEFGNYLGTFKFYINGILKSTTAELYHPNGYRDDAAGLCIGKRGSYRFDGKIDDLAVWDIVLQDWQLNGLVSGAYGPMTIPAEQSIGSDFNSDGKVNLQDFSILAENWFKSSF